MNGYLRQSTASQSRTIGPFVDSTDFVTLKTGLTIANTDIKLRANGTTLSNKNSGGGTHQVNGEYSVTWDATDTANVGELSFTVSVAGALVVFGKYTVLEEAVYDALFAASAAGFSTQASVDGIATLIGTPAALNTAATLADNALDIYNEMLNAEGITNAINSKLGTPIVSVSDDIAAAKVDTAAIKAKTDNLPAAPASTTNITAGTVTTVTNLTNLPAIPANWITTAGITDGAITDAKITFPGEVAGRPTTFLAWVRRIGEWMFNKRIRTRATGAVQLRNAADSADLETQNQSTAGGVGAEIDSQTKGV